MSYKVDVQTYTPSHPLSTRSWPTLVDMNIVTDQPVSLEYPLTLQEAANISIPFLSFSPGQQPAVGGGLGYFQGSNISPIALASDSMCDPMLNYSANSLTPRGARSSQAGYNVSFLSNLQASVPTPTVSTLITNSFQENPVICSYCGRRHSRPVRRRACSNKHTNQYPFPCGGACGSVECPKAFASSERRKVHIQGRLPCEKCGKMGWKRNASRHRARCGV